MGTEHPRHSREQALGRSSATRRRGGRGHRLVATSVFALLALVACSRGRVARTEAFEVTRVFPSLAEGGEPLLLNDSITVHFNEAVDPLSVTSDSFAVLDAEGHPVRGRLRVEGAYVTFEPDAPLSRELRDGSFLPASRYRLVVHGYPRIDGVRSKRGRLLSDGVVRSFLTASDGSTATGLPAPLRPLFVESRPFLMRTAEAGSVPLPVDDPRLQLHFTLPVLPSSVTTSAFEVTLLRGGGSTDAIERVEPAAVRLLPQQPTDEFRGATVELEFGSSVRVHGSDRRIPLEPMDFMGVRLAAGATALLDYAGRPAPIQVQWCNVVPGVAVAVAEWPSEDGAQVWLDSDLAVPGFEVTQRRTIQPLVRAEAGGGSLGSLRPSRDLVIRAGEPFDPGDGVLRTAPARDFEFRAIDIPEGVTVRVFGADGPVRFLAMGRARVAGRLEFQATALGGASVPALADYGAIAEAAEFLLLASSGLEVLGGIEGVAGSQHGALALVTAGELAIPGTVPPGTLLATERPGRIVSPPAGCIPVRVRLQPGMPKGAECSVSGWSPFLALPADRAGSLLRIRLAAPGLRTLWQTAPHDPLQRGVPDLDPARAAPAREAVDGQRIEAPAGSFLRLRLQADLRAGEPLPELLTVRALDR